MTDTTQVFRAEITAVDKASAVLDKIGAHATAMGKAADSASNPWRRVVSGESAIGRAMNMHRDTGGFSGGAGAAGPMGAIGQAMAAFHERNAASLWTTTGAAVAGVTDKMHGLAQASHGAAAAGHNAAGVGHAWAHAKKEIGEVREHVAHLKEHFASLGEKITEIFPPLAALGAGAGIAGLFELTHKVAETAGEFARTALTLGMTTGQLFQLNFAAKMTETPLEAMQMGMGKLAKAIGAAAGGHNKDAAALFAHLGISLKDAHGHLLTAVDAFPRLQEAFRKTTDVTMRQRMAFALFGRSGLEMMALMMANEKEMHHWSETAKHLAYPFTAKDRAGLEEFQHAWIGMETAVNGVVNSVGSKLAPILTPVVEKIAEWVAHNREWIATGITDKVKQLADWVMKLDFDKVAEQTGEWARRVGELVGGFVNFKTIIFGSALAITLPWAAAAVVMVSSLGQIIFYTLKATWAIGTALVGAINGFNAATVSSVLVTGLRAVAAAASTIALSFAAIAGIAALLKVGSDAETPENRAAVDKLHRERRGLDGGPNGPTHDGYDQWGRPVPQSDTTAPGNAPPPPGAAGPAVRGAFGGSLAETLARLRDAISGRTQKDTLDLTVTFENTPPGVGITTRGSPGAPEPQVDVGHAFPGGEFPVPP